MDGVMIGEGEAVPRNLEEIATTINSRPSATIKAFAIEEPLNDDSFSDNDRHDVPSLTSRSRSLRAFSRR